MTVFPYSRIVVGSTKSVIAAGPHVQVVDSQNGNVLHTTTNSQGEEKDLLLKSGPIRCIAVDQTFAHAISTGDDKKLKVWELESLKVLSTRELPKKPTEIAFTKDGQTILIADKFGDIWSYPLHPESTPTSDEAQLVGATKRGTLTSHENPSNGTLILGHVSFLTSFCLSHDEQYIVTADRDEHIRTSWYPQGYNIESYCLGHEKFVSAIHIPSFAQSTLVSGGGDSMLKLWDWMTGAQTGEIPILDTVKPYIKVKPPKGKWDKEEGDDEDRGEGGSKSQPKQGRKGRKRGKGKGGSETPELEGAEGAVEVGSEGEVAEQTGEDERMAEEHQGAIAEATASGESEAQGDKHTSGESQEDRLILVLHKIRSMDLRDKGRLLLFSAVGGNALFYCTYPELGQPVSEIRAVEFYKPVVDFELGPETSVWVTLDPNWSSDASQEESRDEMRLARVLSWASGSHMEVAVDEAPAMLKSLYSACVVPATPEDLKTLDIYSPLASLPKNVDSEHDPLRRDILTEGGDAPAAPAAGKVKGKGKDGGLTQREQARLRKKRALAEKLGKDVSATPGTPGTPVPEERESKKPRSEPDTSVPTRDENAMDES